MATPSRADAERQLLARRGTVTAGSIPRLEEGEAAPLSFAQERMWLLDRMLPNVSAYNVPRLLSVRGRLDAAALQRALNAIAVRHVALRTGISLVDGAPVQEAHEDRIIELEVHDLRARPDADELAATIVSDLAWRRFDLERDPMVRAALFHLDVEDRILLVSHHLVSDHGSARILLAELTRGIRRGARGQASHPPRATDSVRRLRRVAAQAGFGTPAGRVDLPLAPSACGRARPARPSVRQAASAREDLQRRRAASDSAG